ncbi:3-isopropylmalate dehydratase, small subunit family protein, partial [Bordetella hinzii 1277]
AYGFDIDPGRRRLLLEGIDDIGLAWRRAAAIERFQTEQQAQRPWLA